MTDFEKIMEIACPGREPLWEPSPFELAKSRLRLPEQKVLFCKTPSRTKLISINKTTACRKTELPTGFLKDEKSAVIRFQDEISCITFDRLAQKYHMLKIKSDTLKKRIIYEKLSAPELNELINMLQDILKEKE